MLGFNPRHAPRPLVPIFLTGLHPMKVLHFFKRPAPNPVASAWMHLMRKAWPVLFSCLWVSMGHAQTPPTTAVQWGNYKFNTDAQLDYDINGQSHGLNYKAQAQITWHAQANRYNAKFEIQLPLFFGTRTQWSEGLLSEQGVKPMVFTDRHHKTQTASIDQDNGVIKLANNNAIALERQHQDALSVFFQLGALLAGFSEPLPYGESIKLPVLMAQTNEHWTFRLESKDNLRLPYAELAALKIVRLPRNPSDKQKLTLWLSPSLGFLPVRLLIEEDNQDVVDQRLKALKVNP